jgi:PAS domain S-box-containing protein
MLDEPARFASQFPGDSELARLMRAYDWAATPLGTPDTWPQSLRTAVSIMLTSSQPIWIGWGRELIYLYNDPYKSIIGGKHPWALGKPTSQVWREIWDSIGPMLDSAMQGTGTYVEAEFLVMERNGYPEETYYTFSYSPIPGDDGKPGGIFCANTDDTQRVIGERQLALLRELATAATEARTWQQAFELSARALTTDARDLPFAMLYTVAADGKTASLVARAGIEPDHPACLPTLSTEAAAPWPIAEAVKHHAPYVVRDLDKLFAARMPTGAWDVPSKSAVILPVASPGGTGRASLLITGLSPFRLYEGAYASFLELVAGQIAASVASAEAYEEERRRAEALAEIDRAKTLFFSNVSHEFRTPLTLMLSPLEEVLGKPTDAVREDNRQLVSVAHRNGVRLLKLVNALLDFSRIEAGRTRAHFEPVDLSAFTSELASTFRSAIERAGLTLTLDCPPLKHPAPVDRDMWEKIVLNLLSNALKFTFDGGITVRVRPGLDGKSAEVVVSDTGTGIPQAELPHLFERFHRVEGARGRSIEGSGIGLALVLELVKLHGGTIEVQSEVDKGTTFTVRLPLSISAPLPAAGADGATAAPHAEAYLQEAISWLGDDAAVGDIPPASLAEDAALPPVETKGELILLADDNVDMRSYVARLLKGAGYQVETVADGEAALVAARALKPRLVLSDVMMPNLDGIGLMDALRADPETSGIPVILLSARAGEEAKVEGLRAGADDYLTKPFSARELVARVDSNLKLANTRLEAERLLREETQILEEINRVGTAVSAELELEKAVQVVTDSATRLSGAAFGAFFYNIVDDKGESYMLYTLSGVPREAFSNFPMPRNTAVFAPTFAGEATVRSADIRKDPRFGKNAPYYGHPKGHLPVVSYLATPVVSRTGEVLGGLFFGHSKENMFDTRAERLVEAIAVQAAIAIDKARLYRAVQRSEQNLELKVRERTAELAQSNAQLTEEIAQREHAEGRFHQFVEGVTDYAIYALEPNGTVANWNAGAERIKGYAANEIVGRHFENFYTEEDRAAGVPARALKTAREEGKFEAEGYRVRKDGSRFWASVVINPIRDSSGELIGFTKVTRDITERRKAQEDLQRTQEQLAQAQKMEGIGQLTGGVAHDFNNLLTVILGNLETAQRASTSNPNPDRLARALEHAIQGAQRATSLTQRLLAFSRRSPLDPKPLDASRLVTGMSELLRRTLGEQITIESVLGGGLWRVLADPNQLEIAILNLAVNARDAMPDGGRLTIETANAHLDEAYAASQTEVIPGQYVVISISDTGIGMSRETMARAFEPFFTTKDIGHGTTVKLYLPRLLSSDESDTLPAATPQQAPLSAGGETILVVEDDSDVRANTTGMLRELNYNVLEAPIGSAALQMIQTHPEIDLLFTDVGLPGGMNGRQLADAVHRIRPDLKVLFTTGYARNAIVHGGRLDPGVQLLPKPFTFAALASKVAELMDSKSAERRVLLVEDEILVQMVVQEQLADLGCKIETASTISQAMSKVKLLGGNIDLAIIDVGLPDGKGDRLAAELRALYPRLPIVIASGYGNDVLRERFKSDPNIRFIGKPYTQEDLRQILQTLPS